MTEAARLVDELTTLLYEVTTGWDDSAGGHQIVRCGACRRKADRAESVVHESDCPVYRLIRAEESNTAVIRANAEEIADLEDRRDELEAQVNVLTAQMECRNELTARIRALEAEIERYRQRSRDEDTARIRLNHARIDAEAERDALRARAKRAEAALAGMLESYELCMGSELAFSDMTRDMLRGVFINEPERARASLAARGGEG